MISAMDCPSNAFFTEAAFEHYSVQPTFLELLEKYAPKKPALAKAGKKVKQDKGFTESTNTKQKGTSLCSPKPDFWYPRYSNLNHEQHRRYLKLEEKYSQHSLQGDHTAKEVNDIKEFRQYQIPVANEQQEFQKFANEVAKGSPDDYGYLHPLVRAYIKSVHVIGKWCERVKQLPQKYALYQTIGMRVEPVIPSDPVLKHMACLLTLGQAAPVTMQTCDPLKLPVLHHMVSVKEGSSKQPQEDAIQVVSEDANIKKLAVKYHANIVVSFDALVVLLDLHPPHFEQQWEIPITVLTQGDGQSSAKTIYIDKPLKQKKIFPHEANAIFHKAALKQKYTNGQPSIVVDTCDVVFDKQSEDKFGAGGGLESLDFGAASATHALIDLETFGSGLVFPLPKKVSKCKTMSALESKKEEEKNENVIGSSSAPLMPMIQPISSKEQLQEKSEDIPVKTKETEVNTQKLPIQQTTDMESSSPSNKTEVDDVSRYSSLSHDINATSPSNETKVDDVSQDSSLSHDSNATTDITITNEGNISLNNTRDSPSLPDENSGEAGNTFNINNMSVCKQTESDGDVTNSPLSLGIDATTIHNYPSERKKDPNGIRDSLLFPDDNPYNEVNPLSEAKNDQSDISHSPLCSVGSPNESGVSNPILTQSMTQLNKDSISDAKQPDIRKQDTQLPPSAVAEMTVSPSENKTSLPEINKRILRGDSERRNKLSQDSGLFSPPNHGKSANSVFGPHNSSASETDGELIIVSGPEIDSVKCSGRKQSSSNEQRGDNSPTSKEETKTSLPSTPQTRRSKKLEVSLTIVKPEPDEAIITVTQRRSTRIRKAEGSPSEPAKKVKKKESDTKDISDDQMLEEKERNKADVMESTANEGCLSVIGENAQAIDGHITDAGNATAKQMQSPNFMPKLTGNSSKPAALKRTSLATVNSKPISKTPRNRHVSTIPPKSGSKVGGMSSTIDTIMKLQEALHTRKKSKDPSHVPQASSTVSQLEQKQSLFHEENPSDYQPPREGNASYNLWRLGKMIVLIRTQDNGEIKQEDNSQQRVPVTVIPKMEYQTHFGYEQSGISELCQIWVNLYVKPESKVIRGRINAMTSQLLQLEWLDLSSPLWIQCPFNPARSMKMVHTIFDKLQGIPEGNYILSHSPGDKHASVHLALEPGSKKRMTYDLHAAHDAPALQSGPPITLPWLPLDPKLPLPKHVEQWTIPLTFPPRLLGSQGNAAKKKAKTKRRP